MRNIAFVIILFLAACSTLKQGTAPDGAWYVSDMNHSNGFKTKGKALGFGTFEVSRAKYKPSQTTEFNWLGQKSSKAKIGYTFSVKNSQKEVNVKVSEKTKVQELSLSPNLQLLAIPLESSVVQVGDITGENFNWKYCIRDEDWFKTSKENEAGFLVNGTTATKITLARRAVFFYESDTKVGELRMPIDRKFSVWLKDDLDENTKLAISAVCGAILLQIKDNR